LPGFHIVTVAEIAASGFAIGTSTNSLSKEQLYAAMLTEKLAMMYAGIRAAVEEESDILRKIELLVASHFRYVEENAEFCSIFVRGDYLSISEGSAELRARMRSDYARHVAFIEEVMAAGMRTGLLKEMDPPMVAAALMGIVNSNAAKWIALGEGKPHKKRLFLQFSRGGTMHKNLFP
jgi:AcrR family transcriptional regulator